jgi:hybrid cluster-associated redox disulfide protein
MTLAEIIKKRPDAVEKLTVLGLGCVGCHFSQFETLEEGANVHGMDVDELLEELND